MTDNGNKSIRAPLVPPKAMSQLEEDAALRRSEERIFAQLRDGAEAVPQPGLFQQFMWSYAAGLAVMAIVVVSGKMWWGSGVEKPTPWYIKQASHAAQVTKGNNGEHTYHIQAHAQKVAEIAHPKHWKLRAHPTSRLQMTRKHNRHVVVKIHKGGVRVAVNPKKKQRFEVLHKGVSLLVKGTKFSFDTSPRSVRIEVERGHVQTTYKGKIIQLRTGQGIRIDLTQKTTAKRHKLPPKTNNTNPIERLKWLLKQEPKRALNYAYDLLHSSQYPRQKRGQILLNLKDTLYQQRRLREAERLALAIANKELTPRFTEKALYEAGVLCYRQQRTPNTTKRCTNTFKRFLSAFPKSPHVTSVRWYIKTLQNINSPR